MLPARRFAAEWATRLAEVTTTPPPPAQLADALEHLLGTLLTALTNPAWDPAAAENLGSAVAGLGFHTPEAVEVSLPTLRAVCAEAGAAPDVLTCVASRFGFGIGRASASAPLPPPAADGFEVAFRHASVAISIGDAQGRIIDANPAFERLMGRPLEQLRGLDGFELAEDAADVERRRIFEHLAATDSGTVRFEGPQPHPDGGSSWVAWTVTQCLSNNGERTYLLGFGQDLTEQHAVTERLRWQAHHDPLTGLANRRRLHADLHTLVTTAEPGQRVAVLALDVDDFKAINDTHGHTAGDRILAELAARLRTVLDGEETLLARIGGDEFIVVLPPTAIDTARATVGLLREAVVEPFGAADRPIAITISIGATVTPLAGTSVPELLADADECLYRAKALGKNHWALRTERRALVLDGD
ncbi:diguanylate cyclase domain-containing protein [Nocardia thailandica]